MKNEDASSQFFIRNSHFEILLVTAIATLTNVTYYAFSSSDYLFPDSFTYLTPAQNLLRGVGFVSQPGVAETLRTPGYPLLLAAFGNHIGAVIVLQHVLNVLIAAAIVWLAAPRIGNAAATIAGVLFAIDTPSLHYANKILTETLFTGVLLIVFALAVARRWLPLAGLLTGVLVLIRPVAIAYLAVVAFYLLLRRVRARDIAIYALLALALPFGWALRNRVRTGVFTVSSIGGTNLLIYRAGGTLAILDDGENFDRDLLDEGQGLLADATTEIEETLHIPDAGELPHAVLARHYSRMALRVIRQHPLAFAELTLRGLMVNLFDSRWEAVSVISALNESVVRLALDAFTVALFVFAVIGAWVVRRDDAGILIILTIAYFLLISAGGESEARFRVPVMPLYAIAAAAGLDTVRRAAARRPR